MNANLAAILYLVSGVLFILALRGLSSPETSRAGNRNGMIGMAIAVGTVMATLLGQGALDGLTLALAQQGRHHRADRDGHADHAIAVTRPAGLRTGEATQGQDEENPGNEVENGREIGVHDRAPLSPLYFCFFLYMASIRWVTRKPPKMFTAASAAARAPAPLEIITLPLRPAPSAP